MNSPTPHLEKLNATLANDKLPESDKSRIIQAIEVYKKWRDESTSITKSIKEADKMLHALVLVSTDMLG